MTFGGRFASHTHAKEHENRYNDTSLDFAHIVKYVESKPYQILQPWGLNTFKPRSKGPSLRCLVVNTSFTFQADLSFMEFECRDFLS